jgi:ComF family protein
MPDEAPICSICSFRLPKTRYTRHPENPLYRSLSSKWPIESAIAWLYYQKGGLAQPLLHRIKYSGGEELGVYAGKQFAKEIISNKGDTDWDILVPVPLHPRKLRFRGYNQSAAIAKGMSEILQIPMQEKALQRIKYAKSQTQSSREKRMEKLINAFEAHTNQLLEKKVLIVDDVITTGATIGSCIKAIEKVGCIKIGVAALAVTDKL